jgi:hypothetical protein
MICRARQWLAAIRLRAVLASSPRTLTIRQRTPGLGAAGWTVVLTVVAGAVDAAPGAVAAGGGSVILWVCPVALVT